jgi:ketosteroid isomerase-like protein
MKRLSLAVFAVVLLSLCGFAKEAKHAPAKKSGGGPDVAYLQKIWDAWGTLDTANVAAYYTQGPDHTFFDIAPLKYGSWDEYQKGVQALLGDLSKVKFTVNDDVRVHGQGDWAWATATVKEDATTKTGKHTMATFRWTAILEKTGDKWVIVHDHTSVPQS